MEPTTSLALGAAAVEALVFLLGVAVPDVGLEIPQDPAAGPRPTPDFLLRWSAPLGLFELGDLDAPARLYVHIAPELEYVGSALRAGATARGTLSLTESHRIPDQYARASVGPVSLVLEGVSVWGEDGRGGGLGAGFVVTRSDLRESLFGLYAMWRHVWTDRGGRDTVTLGIQLIPYQGILVRSGLRKHPHSSDALDWLW